jgi:hypothetical protein
MAIEYVVLQTLPEKGPLASLTADEVHQSWETLQDALEEVGQRGWELCTTLYCPTQERDGPGEYYCEGFILKPTV